MAAYNTNSENIYVFPVANRPKYDPAGRLTTEYNLTSILNRLLDKKSFVVTQKDNNINIESGEFEFNINGYFFHIVDISDIIENFSSYNEIGVIIDVKTNKSLSGDSTYKNQVLQTINGVDNDASGISIYNGLSFYPFKWDDDKHYYYNNASWQELQNLESTKHYLSLLTKKDDGNWYITESSKIKFETNATGVHKSVIIDDGVLYGTPSAN